jgi:hypothetical protein
VDPIFRNQASSNNSSRLWLRQCCMHAVSLACTAQAVDGTQEQQQLHIQQQQLQYCLLATQLQVHCSQSLPLSCRMNSVSKCATVVHPACYVASCGSVCLFVFESCYNLLACRMEMSSKSRQPVITANQGPPPPNPLVVERFQSVVSQLFQQVRQSTQQ